MATLEKQILTVAERDLLAQFSGTGFYSPLDAYQERTKDGEVVAVKWEQNETALIGQMLIALNAMYPNSYYYVTPTGGLYVYGIKDAQEALEFTSEAFDKHRRSAVDVNGYIQARWGGTYSSIKNLNAVLIDVLSKDKRFTIHPFLKAVEIRANQIKEGTLPRVELQQFKDLFVFDDDNTAPYVDWTLELLIKSPLVAQMGKGYSESMPILSGAQGIGKSHLISELSLGYSTQIKDFSKTDQETLVIRAENVFLESAELANMRKSDVESIKAGLTTHAQDYLPKYSNERTHVKLPAVIVGSTNKEGVLKDLTGERRFLPLAIKDIKHGYDMDFFLSVYGTYYNDMLVSQDFNLYRAETVEDLEYKRDNFTEVDPEVEAIKSWLFGNLERLQVADDDTYYYLITKRELNADFARETRNFDSSVYKIYPGKFNEVIRSIGGESFSKRMGVVKQRTMRVPKSALEIGTF